MEFVLLRRDRGVDLYRVKFLYVQPGNLILSMGNQFLYVVERSDSPDSVSQTNRILSTGIGDTNF